ncbi:type IV pilin-like G/H family protein [Gloeocapsopsis crepidinum LEGE 06123]|uniref:Type IV pilin-like G/H family protein n=1 Tax=Gloeocapsopsis crepidinum LEGE 06123 TaxID=588587 RepID=A0ABR9UYQ7_9CHRO|nr:type IV pilin-like G/H family protein [Gloeocapsopsis crepidinum]MBE9193416.1 type IV pilin-like G/H family protein [Gloeocapsopsis crepidinum LEGE 06123]
MKTELKVKFLQHLTGKKKEEGFTLIELLVVIIIIGILSAIALPSFLNQSAKARASEARTNVGAMNRAQQAYYLENQKFAEDESGDDAETAIEKLSVGIKDSVNYAYTATSTDPAEDVINQAAALNKDLKGHIGGVFSVEGQTPSVLCQANDAGLTTEVEMASPAIEEGEATCQGETTPVGG